MRASELPEARDELNAAGELIPLLQQAYRKDPSQAVSAAILASQAGRSVPEIQRALAVLTHLREPLPGQTWELPQFVAWPGWRAAPSRSPRSGR